MGKYLNSTATLSSIIVGALSYMLGGWDSLTIALLIFMALDYLTGVLKALYDKKLSSKAGFRGIIKKVVILVLVTTAVVVERELGIPAIREVTIVFFAVNEALSIIENSVEIGIPIPEKLKEALLQIREK